MSGYGVALALVAVLANVTGCGQDRRGAGPVPAALAERTGCVQFAPSETDEVGVLEQGTCLLGGDVVVFNTFSNNQIRDLWLLGARQGRPYFVGDRFVGYSDDATTTGTLGVSLDGALQR